MLPSLLVVAFALVSLPAASVSVSASTSASASLLPSIPGAELESAAATPSRQDALEREGKWWFRAGDRLYFTPPEAPRGDGQASPPLRRRITDYYYAYGSFAALSDELRARRVGGDGRLHVFHLPEGLALLQAAQGVVTSSLGDRRSALSRFGSLTQGQVLSGTFPDYTRSQSYVNPLSESGQVVERDIVARMTNETIMGFLTELVSLPSSHMPTRSVTNESATARVQQYLVQAFQSTGLKVCLHKFEVVGTKSANVVAYLPGTTTDVVILGAHYDSRPFSGLAPGAEDNGSGAAVLLAAAKAIMQAAFQPKKSIYFVAFGGEEAGLWGSQAFVHEVLMQGAGDMSSECKASASFLQVQRAGAGSSESRAIVMDEIGWRSPELRQATVNLESYDRDNTFDVMENMAQASWTHNGETLHVVHSNHPFGSDHMSFLDNGLGAVLAINGDDEAYPNYHTSEDNITYVNPELMTMIGRMNLGALLRLAGQAE